MTVLPVADVRGKTCRTCGEIFENGEVICGADSPEKAKELDLWWHERCVPEFSYVKLSDVNLKAIDGHPDAALAIRELVDEEDIPADFELRDFTLCSSCGGKLNSHDIHAGIDECQVCERAWVGTEG